MVAGHVNDECRMQNVELKLTARPVHTSHFATVAERAFVAQRLGRVNVVLQ